MAAGGNGYAALYMLRIAAADDRDAEAEKIVEEIRSTMAAVVLTFQPLAEAMQAWTDDGLAAAEAHANKEPPRTTWPEACPFCGAPWSVKSKTMGRAHGQPHQGTCQNGHRWSEP